MRNREAITRKLESIESNLNKINLALNQGNRDVCFDIINDIREQIDQAKLYVESEPITGSELN